jgi:hypothetical protein
MANIVNGTDLRFYKGGTAIGEATSCQMSFTMETRPVLTKDNVGSFTRVEAGQRSATGSFQGLIAYDTTNESVSDLFDSYKNGEKFLLRFTDDSNGHPYWEQRPTPIGDPGRGPSRPVPPAPSNAAERHHTAVGIAWRMDVHPALVERLRVMLELPAFMTDAEADAISRLLHLRTAPSPPATHTPQGHP